VLETRGERSHPDLRAKDSQYTIEEIVINRHTYHHLAASSARSSGSAGSTGPEVAAPAPAPPRRSHDRRGSSALAG
jgi:hypothetical protein